MKVLYIAYSCSPYHGSEDKIGWNIPLESAKYNEVVVITKEEHRQEIREFCKQKNIENIQFHYVDIAPIYKKVFKGALYSGRLNVWHRKAYIIAKQVCEEKHIDVVHQITPIEFRSIGNYGKIPNIKFVCGPIAGGQCIPRGLMGYIKEKQIIEYIRDIANKWYRFLFAFNKKIKSCAFVLFANRETKDYLLRHIKDGVFLMQPDTCVGEEEFSRAPKQTHTRCRFLVVGRLVYLKGLDLLLDALRRLPVNMEYECCVVGDGKQRAHLEKKCIEYNIDKNVRFIGAIPYNKVINMYDNADVLVFPSFREASGSVVLEAMARGLPVVSMDRFGAATILDEETGWLYDGRKKEDYINALSKILTQCIENPEEVIRKGKNARNRAEEYTWDRCVKKYQTIYEQLLMESK